MGLSLEVGQVPAWSRSSPSQRVALKLVKYNWPVQMANCRLEHSNNIAVSSTLAVTGLTTVTENVKMGDGFTSTGPTLAKTGAIRMDNNLQVAIVVEDSMKGDTVEENRRQRKTIQRRSQKRQKDVRPRWDYRTVAKKSKQRSKKDVRPKLGCRTVAKKTKPRRH